MYLRLPYIQICDSDQLEEYIDVIIKEDRKTSYQFRDSPEHEHILSVEYSILEKLQYYIGTETTEYLHIYHSNKRYRDTWILYESDETDYDEWYAIIGTKSFIETAFFILNAFERTDKE